ncbi:unnamed protein product [Notodromas monacha]|uniref:BRCA1-associated RING domain protein 1 n=1 Tax=Notodromas monacha TaxID=399045 RepID=A0A7R9BHT5_9CRUS|nr:unnamed protein product [Notodromas monacha]CAG0915756.1 unnamed protein product [Notodromas monacha]
MVTMSAIHPPEEQLSTLKSLADLLQCAYCHKHFGEVVPTLMGRNCPHAICASCREGFFPHGFHFSQMGEKKLLTTCPVCHVPVERSDQGDDKFQEFLKCAEAVTESFRELVFMYESEKKLVNNSTPKSKQVPLVGTSEAFPLKPKQTKNLSSRKSATPCRNSASSTPQRDVEKRNIKGETRLHVAVIKGDIAAVKDLLASGASPNVQDNANWTPLHEACNHGFTEITKLLLENGAIVIPGGDYNETPLHEAVIGCRKDIIELLVKHGADPNLRNSSGISALDLCGSDDALLALMQLRHASKEDLTASAEKKICVLPEDPVIAYELDGCHSKILLKVVRDYRWKRPQADVTRETTMLITRCSQADDQRSVKPTCNVMKAVVIGRPIIDIGWIRGASSEDILNPGRIQAFMVNVVEGLPSNDGIRKAQENSLKMLPPLFDGFCIFVLSGKRFEPDDCFGLTKDDLTKILTCGGATILHREPSPGKLTMDSKRPFHAARTHLASTTHLIIYPPSKSPSIHYNMAELKALPVSWLIACIAEFAILDPAPYV